MKHLQVGIVGATGAVGQELLKVLEERKFPVKGLSLFASERSVGKKIRFKENHYGCQVMKPGCFKDVDIAFFDASDAVSKQWVPQAAEEGAWVVDNSATFRMEKEIPLVVPEVNGHLVIEVIRAWRKGGPQTASKQIFSGPNCSTVQLVVPLAVIQKNWGIKRVVVSTYQSTSGAGTLARDELASQTWQFLEGQSIEPQIFQHQIAFNCIPHIGGFKANGYTSEEIKVMEESRKILGLPALKITATAIRVPTLACHGESVNVECERLITPEDFRAHLRKQEGVILQDQPEQKIYPMNQTPSGSSVECGAGRDAIYIGRIRQDESVENGVQFWVISDNLRKGAATNAVQIGEILVRENAFG